MFHADPTLNALDDFALIACQAYNFGDKDSWFLAFRLAVSGMLARRFGLDHHYRILTEWVPGVPSRHHEHELSICLFCMDSGLECWVFAMNAIGHGVGHPSFLSVADDRALRRICPDNVIITGNEDRRIAGYRTLFPTVSALWEKYKDTISLIINNHDVSKHRHANFWGGTVRLDAPPELLQAYGVPDAMHLPFPLQPMKQVLLPREPKLPLKSLPPDLAHWIDLEQVKADFDVLMDQTVVSALNDVRAHVKLADSTLRNGAA